MSVNKILICDDDAGILDMLEFVLEDNGYQIISETDGLKIQSLIEREKPCILLLDLWMPIVSGDQLLRTIRANAESTELPVIVMSASRDGQQIAMDAGADDFIAKPFDIDLLIEKIESYLK